MNGDLLEQARAALEDAEARLKDISSLANGESEEIYTRAYYGNQTRALKALRECGTADKVPGYPWRESHSFLPRMGLDRHLCARCGNDERDQIHNGSLS
jgi:hypothetical protein